MANHKALRLNEERVYKEGFMTGVKVACKVLGYAIDQDAAEWLFEKCEDAIEEIDDAEQHDSN